MTDLEKIKEFVSSGDISDGERKFLVDYMAQMSRCSMAPTNINFDSVANDIRNLNQYLESSDDTSLVRDRINRELEIVSSLASGFNDADILTDASYELERLYYESDLPFRNTDTVIKKIEQKSNINRGR